jgi:hypothetical protein
MGYLYLSWSIYALPLLWWLNFFELINNHDATYIWDNYAIVSSVLYMSGSFSIGARTYFQKQKKKELK